MDTHAQRHRRDSAYKVRWVRRPSYKAKRCTRPPGRDAQREWAAAHPWHICETAALHRVVFAVFVSIGGVIAQCTMVRPALSWKSSTDASDRAGSFFEFKSGCGGATASSGPYLCMRVGWTPSASVSCCAFRRAAAPRRKFRQAARLLRAAGGVADTHLPTLSLYLAPREQDISMRLGHVARRRDSWPAVALNAWRPQYDMTARHMQGLAGLAPQHMEAETPPEKFALLDRATRQSLRLWRAAAADRAGRQLRVRRPFCRRVSRGGRPRRL